MSTILNPKELRKLNKFLRNKVGFIKIQTNGICGEYKINRVRYSVPYENFDFCYTYRVFFDIEFKGVILTRNYKLSLDDFKWTSVVVRNDGIRRRIKDDLFNFVTVFHLIPTDKRNGIMQIGSVKWVS